MPAADLDALLERAPLFADLNEAEREEIKGALRPVTFQPGELIYRQGAEGDALYLVAEGRVSLSMRLPGDDAFELALVGPDQVFGEMALVDAEPRVTSARAAEATRAWILDSRFLEAQVMRLDPGAFKVLRRLARIVCERLRQNNREVLDAFPAASPDGIEPSAALSSQNMRRVLTGDRPMLRFLPIFEELTDRELIALTQRMHRHEVPRGQILFAEGERGRSCFVTVRGAVEVSVLGAEKRRLAILGPATIFGQIALLDGGPRTATCKVRENAVLLELDKDAMEQLFLEGGPIAFKLMRLLLRAIGDARRMGITELARLATQQRLSDAGQG